MSGDVVSIVVGGQKDSMIWAHGVVGYHARLAPTK